jgi:hypothetical protein
MLAIWMQSSSQSHAQNAAPTSTTNPLEPAKEAPAVPPPALAPSGTNSSSATPNLAGTPTDKAPPTFERAAALYGQGKQDEALIMINEVLQIESKSANPYILRGAGLSNRAANGPKK